MSFYRKTLKTFTEWIKNKEGIKPNMTQQFLISKQIKNLILCYAFFGVVFTQMYSILSVPIIVEILFLATCFCLISFYRLRFRLKTEDIIWILPLILLIVHLLFNFNPDIIRDILVWIIGITLISKRFSLTEAYSLVTKLYLWAGAIYAASILFQYFWPSIYFDSIWPLFKSNYGIVILQLWRSSLTIPTGLTHQIGFTIGYVVVGVGTLFFTNKDNHKLRRMFLALLFLTALLLSKKRMHFVASIFCLVFVYLISVPINKGVNRLIKVAVLSAIVLFITIKISEIYNIDNVFNRLQNSILLLQEGKNIATSRSILSEEAINIWRNYPIFGVGWRGFASLGYDYTTVHNIFLQLLCETGILGLICFISPLIYSFIVTFMAVIAHRGHKDLMYNYLCFSMYYQAFFLLYCFTGNPLYDYSYIIPLFIAIAISNDYRQRGQRDLFENIIKV